MDTFGDRLRFERERLKLNQTQFAEAGGVKKNAQIRYEGNQRLPDAGYLQLVASIGVDVLFLITGQRNENTASTPIELSYLRLCRSLPSNDARMAGNAALVGVLSMYGGQMNTMQASNDYGKRAAQDGGDYGKTDES